MSHPIQARRPNLVLVNNANKICQFMLIFKQTTE